MKIIAIAILLITYLISFSQNETKEVTVLMLNHASKDKHKIIQEGKKVKIWIKEDAKVKGIMDSIGTSSIIIEDIEYDLSDIWKLSAKTTGLKVLNASGYVLLGTGTLITGFGGYLIYYAYAITDPSKDACNEGIGDVILVTFGVVIAAVGAGTLIIGAIPALITGPKYNLEKKWQLEITTVEQKVKRKKQR